MPEPFSEAMRNWQNFYFMAGGAGATLIGLVFVAVSLGMGLISSKARSDLDAFVTPILVHFSTVLLIGCIMLIPSLTPFFLAAMLLGIGLFGVVRVTTVIRYLFEASQRKPIGPTYWLLHAIAPFFSHALMTVIGSWLWLMQTPDLMIWLALATVLLLLVGIWRTWELVIWIAQQAR